MSAALALALACAVLAAWLAAAAFGRLKSPLERLHVVTFLNVAGGGPVVVAAWLSDGFSPRAVKCLALWLATLLIGALLGHVTGHALHVRDGERE